MAHNLKHTIPYNPWHKVKLPVKFQCPLDKDNKRDIVPVVKPKPTH